MDHGKYVESSSLREPDLDAAILVAALAHQVARTPKERRIAWDRLMALKTERNKQKDA